MTTTNTDRAATIQDRPPNFRDESGHLFLVRCFNCEPTRGRENYALAVAVGVCPECGWCKVERDDAEMAQVPALPDSLMAKVTEAIASRNDILDTLDDHWREWAAKEMAEAALTAADVPGLLAEIDRLRGSIVVEKQWRKDANDRAEVLLAERDEVRTEAEKWKQLYAEQRDATKFWDEKTRKVIRWTSDAPSSMAAIERLAEEVERLERERDEARKALADCVEPLLTLINHPVPVCDKCLDMDGNWIMAVSQARRLLGAGIK